MSRRSHCLRLCLGVFLRILSLVRRGWIFCRAIIGRSRRGSFWSRRRGFGLTILALFCSFWILLRKIFCGAFGLFVRFWGFEDCFEVWKVFEDFLVFLCKKIFEFFLPDLEVFLIWGDEIIHEFYLLLNFLRPAAQFFETSPSQCAKKKIISKIFGKFFILLCREKRRHFADNQFSHLKHSGG